jgi:hypothetical protein
VSSELEDCLDRFYDPAGRISAPPVKFRPAIDELDDDLLSRALGPGAKEAIAYLRDCYRRLG